MKLKITFINALIVLMTVTSYSFAQTDSSRAHKIRVYIKHIDSLIETENASSLIVDGVIAKKFIVTPKGGGKPHSFYMTVGGYGEEISSNRDTLYRAEYNGGWGYYVHEAYYYQNNKLVAAHVIVRDHKKILLDREDYYQDDKVIFSSAVRKRLNDLYLNKVNDSMYGKGSHYLNDFLTSKFSLR